MPARRERRFERRDLGPVLWAVRGSLAGEHAFNRKHPADTLDLVVPRPCVLYIEVIEPLRAEDTVKALQAWSTKSRRLHAEPGAPKATGLRCRSTQQLRVAVMEP